MKKSILIGLLTGMLIGSLSVACWKIKQQQATINELIDLNHDKSEYIDAGCRGRYQGSEETLPPTPTMPTPEFPDTTKDCSPRDDSCANGCP